MMITILEEGSEMMITILLILILCAAMSPRDQRAVIAGVIAAGVLVGAFHYLG